MQLALGIGVVIGLGVLIALAFVYSGCGARKNWRGAANAIAVGLALGAMLDLVPVALEQFLVLVGALVQTLLVDSLARRDSSLALVGSLITRTAIPVGAFLILLLYFTGNNVPKMGDVAATRRDMRGWRARLVIPGEGRMDWVGIVLLTAGLAMQNLWLGQTRGVLIAPDASAGNLFLYSVTLIGTLRGLALFGPFVKPVQHALRFIGCDLLLGAAVIAGVLYPDTMRTLTLGVLPLFIGVMVLPVAIGRLLRVLENGTGMNWRVILISVMTLGIERGAGVLLVRMAHGQV